MDLIMTNTNTKGKKMIAIIATNLNENAPLKGLLKNMKLLIRTVYRRHKIRITKINSLQTFIRCRKHKKKKGGRYA